MDLPHFQNKQLMSLLINQNSITLSLCFYFNLFSCFPPLPIISTAQVGNHCSVRTNTVEKRPEKIISGERDFSALEER